MKKMNTIVINSRILLIFIFFFLCLTHTARSSTIAYIYSADSTNASAYKLFLNSIGSQTTLVEMGDIVNTDFSQFDVIIIGSNSGSLMTWGDPASVDTIVNSNKPILGLGEGGYAFYGKLSLNIGFPNGSHASGDNLFVAQPDHPIFNSPNTITLPQDSVIQLYIAASSHVNIYFPAPVPEVMLLGRVPSLPSHYLIVQEQIIYFIWGFRDSPASMTQTGKDLFDNIINYMSLVTSSVKDDISNMLNQFRMFQNYPNPFNPGTKIKYSIPQISQVQIKVFDVLGNEIETLINEEKPAGTYELTWIAANLPSGVYFYRLQAGDFIWTKKMLLLK